MAPLSVVGYRKRVNLQSGSKLPHSTRSIKGNAVIMIHGGLLTKEMWGGSFEKLAQLYRVVQYDVRNHGKSRSVEESWF